MVIRGSYYLSGDSVLFQAGIMDVASGRILRSFDPVGAPVETGHRGARGATGADRGRSQPAGQSVRTGLSRRSRPGSTAESRRLPRVCGRPQKKSGRLGSRGRALSPGSRLDSTFVAPLIQLAFDADLERRVLDHRFDRHRARSAPRPADAVGPHAPSTCCAPAAGAIGRRRCVSCRQRYRAYPQSAICAGYVCHGCLQYSNQPRAARRSCANWVPGGSSETQIRGTGSGWPWRLPHMLGEYQCRARHHRSLARLDGGEWQVVRGRALAALGREREVMELLQGHGRSFSRLVRGPPPEDRDRACGSWASSSGDDRGREYPGAARARPQRLEPRRNVALANRLLGRKDAEREALERSPEAMPTRWRGWKRKPGSLCSWPTPPVPGGSTASWRSRAADA